jgi:hypothetical protein
MELLKEGELDLPKTWKLLSAQIYGGGGGNVVVA